MNVIFIYICINKYVFLSVIYNYIYLNLFNYLLMQYFIILLFIIIILFNLINIITNIFIINFIFKYKKSNFLILLSKTYIHVCYL